MCDRGRWSNNIYNTTTTQISKYKLTHASDFAQTVLRNLIISSERRKKVVLIFVSTLHEKYVVKRQPAIFVLFGEANCHLPVKNSSTGGYSFEVICLEQDKFTDNLVKHN
jgi:hypothetical protein